MLVKPGAPGYVIVMRERHARFRSSEDQIQKHGAWRLGDRILKSRSVGYGHLDNTGRVEGAAQFGGKGLSGLLAAEKGQFLFAALVVIAVVVAAAVRWYGLAAHSLWFDEGYTLWLSQFSPRDIWERLREDTSPPLYYWLVHFWTRLFGISETALRGMSAFFATVSIPLFFGLAKQVLQKKTAVLALWLYAVCVFQVHYAKEARFYALLAFCSIASLYCLIKFLDQGTLVSFVGLVMALAAGLYTHNMMWFYMPGLVLAWLLYPSGHSLGRRVRDGLLCGTLVLLIYLPWFPSLVMQTRAVASFFWVPKPTPRDLADIIFKLSGLDFFYIYKVFYLMLPVWPFSHARAFTLALMLPLVPCVGFTLWKVAPWGRRKAVALLCYSLGPVLLAFFYSLRSTSVFLDRTFIASSAVVLILISCSVAYHTGIKRRLSGALAAAVLLGSTISLIGFFKYHQTEDWRGMTEYLNGIPGQKRLIVFATGASQALFDYYSTRSQDPRHAETGLPKKFNLEYSQSGPKNSDEQAVISLREAVGSASFDEIDVIVSHAPQQRRELVQRYLEGWCASLEEEKFGGIKIVRCITSRNGV